MATKYQMQAQSSTNLALYSWLAAAPDWAAVGYGAAGHPGTPLDVTLTGGGIDNSASVPDDAFVDHAGNPFVDHAGNPFVAS